MLSMKFCIFIVFSLLASRSIAAPSSRYAVHQTRDNNVLKLIPRDDILNREATIPLSIGLAQSNLAHAHQFLMDVSHPDSPNYGKHWTPKKVVETFSPKNITIIAVKSWLLSEGVSEERIKLSVGRNWLRINLTIYEAESLLKTEYKVFEDGVTGKRALACDMYSIPSDLRQHIDFITPTISPLSLQARRAKRGVNKASHHFFKQEPASGLPGLRPLPQLPTPPRNNANSLSKRDSGASTLVWDLSVCPAYITRACIQALYNMPNGTLNASSHAYAVTELFNDDGDFATYSESDLQWYLYELVTADNWDDQMTIYTMEDATGIPGQTSEGNIDTQIGFGLIYPQTLSYHSINSWDVFLDAVDASYCSIDAASPDCGTVPLASVISYSYDGTYEVKNDPTQTRQCNEFMKLGLLGTTVIASAGDYGVGALPGDDDNCVQFVVNFPPSCPYVTSVGATQIPSGGTLAGGETVATDWTGGPSAGGFSNQWSLPSWQKTVMSTYYTSHAPPYTSAQYNNSQQARGYPDLTANGNGVLTVQDGAYTLDYGTSCSAPIIGGFITLINEQRINVGKSTVGFINPVLYSNTRKFNDITVGNNSGCGTGGFSAVTGWDPVLGLGTPKYTKMLAVWLALS